MGDKHNHRRNPAYFPPTIRTSLSLTHGEPLHCCRFFYSIAGNTIFISLRGAPSPTPCRKLTASGTETENIGMPIDCSPPVPPFCVIGPVCKY